jgi:hypothetical protein
MERQSRHLREVTHRRLAGIRLPVRVSGERSCGVEGEVLGCNCAEMLRVEWQHALDPLDHVEHEHRYPAEQKHRDGVFAPAHFPFLVDASDPVKQALDRSQHGIKKRPFPCKYSRHEDTKRLGDGENQRQKYEDLQPAVDGHFRISPDATAHRTDKSSSPR